MADPATSLELTPLPRELSARARLELRGELARLLRFHRTLAGSPSRVRAPRASPIVAIYARGVLRGCAIWRGTQPGGERLARAFLAATASLREERELAVQVFYARQARWLDDPASLDIGREGVALVRRDAAPVLLMPQVARDHAVDARGMLALLAHKAGLARDRDADSGPAEAGLAGDLWRRLPRGARLAAWTVESVVAREGEDVEGASERAAVRSNATAADYAAAWLARMVDARGAVAFAIDARARVLQPQGELWHARSAVAIEALAAHGGHTSSVSRARRWLGGEVSRALRGSRIAAWPTDRATVAGTIALCCLAGIPAHDRLLSLVADGRWRDLATSPAWPWHAGQIAAALARSTPPDLWTACLATLPAFAPYVALAARAIGDEPVYRRAATSVAKFIRLEPPHAGGSSATALPETALTAVAAHALAHSRHRAEHSAALSFIHARQLLPSRISASLDPTLALGGFTGSPIDDILRADITGHALLALLT
jgi:hypothetical protein